MKPVDPHLATSSDTPDPWEALLNDAIDAPPVPERLSRRLDQALEDAWGQSPELVPHHGRGLLRIASASLQSVKAWSMIAGIAATLVVAFLVATTLGSSAWAAMIDAIARQEFFQVAVTARDPQIPPQSQASPVALASVSGPERSRLFLSVVMKDQIADRGSQWLNGVRLIDENWTRENGQRHLTATFETTEKDQFTLKCLIDPDTSLPSTVQIQSDSLPTKTVAMSYADATPTRSADRVSNVPREENADVSNQAVDVPPNRQTDVANNSSPTDTISRNYTTKVPEWQSVQVHSLPASQVVRQINQSLESLWATAAIQPARPASDQELMRRVYLDLAGRTPSVTEVRHYLADNPETRYEQLVDRLLDSSDHASHLATTWRTMLIPEGVDVSRLGGLAAFDEWLTSEFLSRKPYDEIVRELLLAEGRLSKSGPLLFYSALKLEAEKLAAKTSRVFLGIRLECAQCHDHPFEPWTQEDFWSYAAFFAQISRPKGDLQSVSSVMQVRDVQRGEVMLPETELVMEPRFLGVAFDDLAEPNDPNLSANQPLGRREQLARWLTDPQNPYFARATANRIWSMMFGRGIVDPVDDFGSQNQPVAPELLELLASQLIDSDFQLREVFRSIALSDAYRLSSAAESEDPERLRHFAQMQVKTLTAAQLYDCIAVATLMPETKSAAAMNVAFERIGNSSRDQFLQQFASPPSNRVDYLAGIPQALTLMNGELIHSATGDQSSGLLGSLDAPFFTDDQRIEVLYLATLSRPPRESELELLRQVIDKNPDQRREVLSDLLWALVNSAEFTLNH